MKEFIRISTVATLGMSLLQLGSCYSYPASMTAQEPISFREKASKFAKKSLIALDLSLDASLLAAGTTLFGMYHLVKTSSSGGIERFYDNSLVSCFRRLEENWILNQEDMTYPWLSGVGGNSMCIGALSLLLASLVAKISGNNPRTIDEPVTERTTDAEDVVRKFVSYFMKGGAVLVVGGMAIGSLEALDLYCASNNISFSVALKGALVSWRRIWLNNLVPAALVTAVGLAIAQVTGHKPLESLKNMQELSARFIKKPSEFGEYLKSRVIDSQILTGILSAITGISPKEIRNSVNNQYNGELYNAWCTETYWTKQD